MAAIKEENVGISTPDGSSSKSNDSVADASRLAGTFHLCIECQLANAP
jgi:hypothetical protein